MKHINIEYLEKIIEHGKANKITARAIAELLDIPRTRAETYGAIYSNKEALANVLKDFAENAVTIQSEFSEPTAWDEANGRYFSIEEYCELFGIDINTIRSYRLLSNRTYSLTFKPTHEAEELTIPLSEVKAEIKKYLDTVVVGRSHSKPRTERVGVVKIADLHLGAYVDGLIRTKKYSIDILANLLSQTADEINQRGYKLVHIHLLGDLIESFTGLSHKNTWKGLDKAMVGAEAIKLVTKILHDNLLSRIDNLGEIKIVAGNHDRVTSDNKEDVQGDGASLIAWGLEMLGYNVEFNPLVIQHIVEGICHLLTHGHHSISKKSTQQLVLDYGKQGMFNLICEGHLHSIIERLSERQKENFQTVKDDAVDYRRMNCPSYFTGNFYSESLGYTSQSGFVITEDNGKGVPNVFQIAL